MKTKFKDLSFWLKTAAVIAWIYGAIFLFYFVVGMFIGIESII